MLQVRKSDGALLNELLTYRETLSRLMAGNPLQDNFCIRECLLKITVTQDELVSLGYIF